MGYMEATERLKYPYLITRDTSPSRAVLEVFRFSLSDGCPTAAPCLASTQVMRSRRVSSPVRPVLLTGHTGTHQSDRLDPPVKPVWSCCSTVFGSSILALWINQGTQWFSGEPLETPRTRCSLRQSSLMTRLPRSPGSTLVLRLNQETVHDFILLFMPLCDRKPNKSKEQDYMKKTSLGFLRRGQRLDTSETKLCSSKERKPPNQSSKNHKELPLHTCKLP
jgi:hypothetical protein